MNENPLEDREHWRDVFTRIYRDLKGSRHYALTEPALDAGAGIAKAWREDSNSFANSHTEDGQSEFAKFLRDELGPLTNLFQENAADPPTLPKAWIDPVSGQALENTWKTNDARGRQVLGKRDPKLAEFFQQMAKSPYEHVAKLQDAQRKPVLKRQPYRYRALGRD